VAQSIDKVWHILIVSGMATKLYRAVVYIDREKYRLLKQRLGKRSVSDWFREKIDGDDGLDPVFAERVWKEWGLVKEAAVSPDEFEGKLKAILRQ